MSDTIKRGPGRPVAEGPCIKCGSDEWKMRRKVTGGVERISRSCVPCARVLRRAAKARARARNRADKLALAA